MTITTESAENYRDDGRKLSLNSGTIKRLLNQSPYHAWAHHPGGGALRGEESDAFDLGTAVHSYILEGVERFAIIDAQDWRTKEAKAQRDAARADGKTPILAPKVEMVRGMCAAIRKQLGSFSESPRPLSDGKPEQTLRWDEDGVPCRARLDWLRDDMTCIDDLKTTAGSAEPDAWGRRQLYPMGFDIQAAWYLRGLRASTGKDASFRFVVAEVAPPHCVSIVALAPSALNLATDKIDRAVATWRDCLARNVFPGYPRRTRYVDAPAWAMAEEMARVMDEEEAGS